MPDRNAKPIETIKLESGDKKRFVEELNQTARPMRPEQDRRRLRVDYNIGDIEVAITQPTGSRVDYLVVPRNLSANGVAFLHGGFVYVGSVCEISLRMLDGQHVRAAGRVVACRHVAGMIHEVAMRFDSAINLALFVDLTPEQQTRIREELNQMHRGNVVIGIALANGQRVKYSVAPMSISAQGISFLHGISFPPESACEVALFGHDGGSVQIKAKVMCSSQTSPEVHEVMVTFDKPVDMEALAGGAAAAEGAGPVEAPSLAGHVLVVDDPPTGGALFSRWLGRLGLEVATVASNDEASAALQEGAVHLIVLDCCEEGGRSLDLISTARDHGFAGPVIAVSADDRDEVLATALRLGANAFLAKPCDSELLEQIVSQLLTCDIGDSSGGGAIYSSLPDGSDMLELISQFVEQIRGHVEIIGSAAESEDLATIRKICLVLKGTAGSYGFGPLTSAARDALEKIDADPGNMEGIRHAVTSLIAVARRVETK